jgi:hypothetical protein
MVAAPRLTRKQLAEFLAALEKLCAPAISQGPPVAAWWGRRPLCDPAEALAWAESADREPRAVSYRKTAARRTRDRTYLRWCRPGELRVRDLRQLPSWCDPFVLRAKAPAPFAHAADDAVDRPQRQADHREALGRRNPPYREALPVFPRQAQCFGLAARAGA